MSSIIKTTIRKKELKTSIDENIGIKPFNSFRSIYNFADIKRLINMLNPPVNGVGLYEIFYFYQEDQQESYFF